MRTPRLGTSLLALTAPLSIVACADVEDPIPPPSIAWVDCADNAALDCGTLSAPVDYDDPYGPTFAIPVVRSRAVDPDRKIGSIVVNPGGPGGSGVQLAKLASLVFAPELRERFDIVGFDPRGEVASTPAIDCADDLDAFVALDTTPDDAAEEAALLEESQSLADGCQSRSAPILRFVGTDSIVRDMDRLREALGDEKLTYLGFSYGTFLGAIYADTFPERVRALVLDGALDPRSTTEEMIEGQALGFEEELEEMLAWCAGSDECALNTVGEGASDPAAIYDALLAEVESSAIPGAGGRSLGPGEFSYAVSAALYQPGRWPGLAEALALLANEKDPSALLDLADGYTGRRPDGSFDNGMDVYYAVTSIDSVVSRDPADVKALAESVKEKAPRIGAYLPYSILPSALWPVRPWREAGPVTAEGAPPILVVGSTRDPATPWVWSKALSEQLPHGVLLTREGDGHTSFLRGNACIDDAVVGYLVDGTAPENGTVCKD